MKRITRWAAAATIAAAAAVPVAMAASASAATVTPAVTMAAHHAAHLSGPNTLDLTYNGTTYTYPVYLHTFNIPGGTKVIWGSLFDKYLKAPTWLPIHGTQNGDDVQFNVDYSALTGVNANGPQGLRGFTLVINPVTHEATGVWDEASPPGGEFGSGTAFLVNPV